MKILKIDIQPYDDLIIGFLGEIVDTKDTLTCTWSMVKELWKAKL